LKRVQAKQPQAKIKEVVDKAGQALKHYQAFVAERKKLLLTLKQLDGEYGKQEKLIAKCEAEDGLLGLEQKALIKYTLALEARRSSESANATREKDMVDDEDGDEDDEEEDDANDTEKACADLLKSQKGIIKGEATMKCVDALFKCHVSEEEAKKLDILHKELAQSGKIADTKEQIEALRAELKAKYEKSKSEKCEDGDEPKPSPKKRVKTSSSSSSSSAAASRKQDDDDDDENDEDYKDEGEEDDDNDTDAEAEEELEMRVQHLSQENDDADMPAISSKK